uniref:C25 family cysteine peptidase n=1 Tax=Fulvivirga sp. TaxID=1931237 RepID=UPI00404B612B
TVSEQSIFKSYVEEFERVAEGKFMGAEVVTQFKKTTDAVEFFNIAEEVNSGKSLITFFGHSGSSSADIDIGFASNPGFGYNNKGKYPVILVNGCNAGDLYSTVIGFGEDWVHTPNRGAIAFMAHSNLAFSNTLRLYSGLFYETAFASDTYFGTSLGQIRAELARQYFARYGSSGSSISQVEQFVLLGDPAVKVFAASKADYAIDGLDITASSVEGTPLTGTESFFYLNIPISNYGKFENDSIEINVVRTLADGSIQNLGNQKFLAISRNGTVKFVVKNNLETTNAGTNMFKVTIDPSNKIVELDKTNNTASTEIFIATGATVNLYPANFGIVGSKNVSLIVQATNPIPAARTFTVEVDTTSKFNSGFLKTFSKQGSIIAVFDADFTNLKDSTVIYWRSKIEGSGTITEPITTSFSYISGVSSGFAIRHEDQYPALIKQKLSRNVAAKSWEFVPNTADIKLLTFGAQAPGVSLNDIQLLYNNLNFNVNSSPLDPGCRNNTINMVAFNSESTVPYKVIEYNALDVLNALVCGRVPQIIYNFTQGDITGGSRHFNAFLNASKTNDIVLIFTIGTVNFENFDPSIKNALADVGLSPSQIGQLKNGNPFIILGKKGASVGSATVIVNNNTGTPENQQILTLESKITGVGSSGTLISPLIGPAQEWGSFVGNTISDDIFSIVGVTKEGQEEVVYSSELPKSFNLEFISTERYPNLRIKLQMEDKITFKPTDMKAWQVLYQPIPEGVLFKDNINPIIVANGSNAETEFIYWNVSPTSYKDSLVVNINSRNNITKKLSNTKYSIGPLTAGDSSIVKVPLKGIDNIGKSSILMSVLPKSDKEQYLPNNRLNLPDFFEVVTDDRNPILDVAFDGAYIMDGDIVSPNPIISIQVKDDNPIVKKVDTTGITIQLKKPCSGCDFERIALSSPNISWQPATSERDFSIEYTPQSLEDGTYGLRVQATDAAGNNAGAQPYQINFQVINESSITHFYPYPNPFSTSTRFVFTLTGNVIPDELKIQIMTVTGRVVREITQDELGPIRIGNNISEYAWNGRDEFGDLLANGVYLYRVITRGGGQAFDLRATEGDKAFTKGFGKLYILR